ncbi:MAG TPA: hypothetical protein VML55_08150 [Planctomycetaceae bacterium]|nr:hypothetical protein [Planctomycetaceae bacterium]
MRERIVDARSQAAELTDTADRDLPVPFGIKGERQRIEISGPLRQGDVLHAIESDSAETKRRRFEGRIYVCFPAMT